MKSCPKCGGTSGFNTTFTVKYNQQCTWDLKDDDAESADGTNSKMCECIDCGAKFRRSTIEKLNDKENEND